MHILVHMTICLFQIDEAIGVEMLFVGRFTFICTFINFV